MKLESVVFLSREEAEAYVPNSDEAVISINDSLDDKANLREGWHSVLRLYFLDIDDSCLRNGLFIHKLETTTGRKVEDLCFREEHVVAVSRWLAEVSPNVTRIVVHCVAGVSRSAAIAKHIADRSGINLDKEHDGFNTYIYRLLSTSKI